MGSLARTRWLGTTLLATACYTGEQADDRIVADGGEGEDDGASGGETPPPDGLEETKGHTPIRRLTADEYRNTVQDLFGVEPPALSDLPTDSDVAAFRTTVGQLTTMNDVDKYLDAATMVADQIAIPCDGADERACVDAFLADEGTRVFRRPMTDAEREHYAAMFTDARSDRDFAQSVSAMLEAMLVAPQFLFLLEPRPDDGIEGEPFAVDGWTLASRLSYLLWDTVPDDELLALAESGELLDTETLEAQAERMLDHERARGPVRSFLADWLALDRLDTLYVDATAHPELTPEVVDALAEETRRFTEDAYWNGDDTLSALLVSAHEGAVTERSFGLLSQPAYLMAINRNPNAAPIHRGKFLLEKLLCIQLVPPAGDTIPPLPDVDQSTTTRERIEQHTSAPECASCHALMNPLGFALEHFDAQGRWRADEDGLPIDARVELVGTDIEGPVDGALALSRELARSEMVRECTAELMWEFVFGRPPEPEDRPSLDPLVEEMRESGNLRALALLAVRSPMFFYRVEPE